MAAIAHGWNPPAGSEVADIPVSVAKDFNAADKVKAAMLKGKKNVPNSPFGRNNRAS